MLGMITKHVIQLPDDAMSGLPGVQEPAQWLCQITDNKRFSIFG